MGSFLIVLFGGFGFVFFLGSDISDILGFSL